MSLKDSLDKTNLDRGNTPTNLLQLSKLFTSFDKTKFDLEDKEPNSGAPINAPKYNYIQKYTPTNTYLDKFQEERSHNSGFGTEGDIIENDNLFKKTNLDLERQSHLGGPINTKSTRHAKGFVHKYTPTTPFIIPGEPNE